MNTAHKIHARPRLSVIAASLLAWSSAYAAEPDAVTMLTKPQSSVSLGIGVVSGEHHRFGQYNGLDEDGTYGLADVTLVKRDDATGTWLSLNGRNLGLDTRELRFDHQRQGDWRYFIDFNQVPRVSQYTFNTGLQGIGSDNVNVQSTGLRDVQAETKRKIVTLGADKYFSGNWDVQIRFRDEEKDGTRLFARGTATRATFEFLAEPTHSTTRQLDATVAYTAGQLQLVGGYYGSTYDNHNPWLNVGSTAGCTAGASTANCLSPISLPPDNQAHQLHLSGGYNFGKTTRANFKLAYTRATQNEAFGNIPFTTVGRSDLGGRIDTTLAQVGLAAQPLPKLSLNANLRYEDKDDKTIVAKYFGNPGGVAIPAGSTLEGTNEPRSLKTLNGKLEAGYQLPAGFRLNGGIEYESKERNTSEIRAVSFRDKVEETSYRVDVRRALADTVTGAVTYIHSDRSGSDFRINTRTTGLLGSNLIAPVHLADRTRDKLRLAVDWLPIEPLSLQFIVDHSDDDYSRSRSILGVDAGQSRFYSLDATYQINEAWQLSAWTSRETGQIDQVTVSGATATGSLPAAGPVWATELRTDNDAFGIGIKGKATSKLQVGADLQWSDDRYSTPISKLAGTAALPANLPPDYFYQRLGLKLFGTYAVQKNAGVRVEVLHERLKTDDWTWSQWTYTDGTRILESALQKSNFIGVSGYYKWW